MGRDISKSFKQIGFIPKNPNINENIRNVINESYYFGYKWKDRLAWLTNHTHSRPIYKLTIIEEGLLTLEKITTNVVINNLKLVNIDIYHCQVPKEFQLSTDYQDNIDVVEQYILNTANKSKISKYNFKILENECIFSIMDANYTILKHNSFLESSDADGYFKSIVSISSLLKNYIIPR